MDFRTRDFYEARRPAIEERLAFIRDGPIDAIVERVGRTWRDNHGQSSLVSWDRFVDVEPIECLLRCIPLSVLAALCERLLQDYRYFRSGFPDLTVWNPQDRVKPLLIVDLFLLFTFFISTSLVIVETLWFFKNKEKNDRLLKMFV